MWTMRTPERPFGTAVRNCELVRFLRSLVPPVLPVLPGGCKGAIDSPNHEPAFLGDHGSPRSPRRTFAKFPTTTSGPCRAVVHLALRGPSDSPAPASSRPAPRAKSLVHFCLPLLPSLCCRSIDSDGSVKKAGLLSIGESLWYSSNPLPTIFINSCFALCQRAMDLTWR